MNNTEYLFIEYKPNENNNIQVIHKSYIDLIKGDLTYNNGNYVLYFGSESCPDCNLMIYNTLNIEGRGSENEKLSIWHRAHEHWQKQLTIKFIMYSDKLDGLDDSQKILPWKRHTEDNLELGHIKGNYIRSDESAIIFRKIHEKLREHIGVSKTTTIPTIILYKSGIPIVLGYDKFEEIEEKNKQNLDNELIEFMLCYYNTNSKLITFKD